MNWYREHKNEWKEIIETVAAEKHRTPQMVEKDTIQSMFLLEISESDLPLAFKGGTSLSKAYDVIDRFSEDIDLSANKKLSDSEKRKTNNVIINTGQKLGLFLNNQDMIKSRHNYNKYIFEYDSLFDNYPMEIIVETSFYIPVYPCMNHTVNSFVGKFCQERKIILPIPFDASVIEMQVQSLQRTFIDKVFAVCDCRLKNMKDRDSRHLYDIAKILPVIQIDGELVSLIDKVRKDRMLSKNNPSAQLEYSINEMLRDIIKTRFYEQDYNTITNKLLYETFSYEDAITKGISIVADLNIFK